MEQTMNCLPHSVVFPTGTAIASNHPCATVVATMIGEKTREIEKKEKKRTKKGLSSSIAPPLPGWIQGDWLPSTVIKEQVLQLVADGLVPEEGWRLPAPGELEPVPHLDERVLLISHIERAFSLLPHPFSRLSLDILVPSSTTFPQMPLLICLASFPFVKISLGLARIGVSLNTSSHAVLKV